MANKFGWAFSLIYFDERLNSKQRVFCHLVIKYLRQEYDPRKYESMSGYVSPLGDFSKSGGANLLGYYKFKPTKKIRKNGMDIRIIFQIMINGQPVLPSQLRIPRPNERNCQLRIVYIGFRDDNTYDVPSYINMQELRVRPDLMSKKGN